MDKIEQLTEDLADEKKTSNEFEERLDKLKAQMEKKEEIFKENVKQIAELEIENDELKNDARQMGFMVEDLELKLDS